MNWIEITVHTTNEAVEAISNILNELDANGVVIEDPIDLTREKRDVFGEVYALDSQKYPRDGVIVKAYFLQNKEWRKTKEVIHQRIDDLQKYDIPLGENEITYLSIREEDWENEWKKYFKPTRVTDRFTIVPSWENYEKQLKEEKIISMDPGMAFGTGTHPTTILSLQALEKMVRPHDIVMDVGVGSGILSIAAVMLGAQYVYAYDLDEVAVNSSINNIRRNHLEKKITVEQNDLLNGIDKKVNVIVSNILADILVRLADEAWNNLQEDGFFITSGIIQEKKKMVIETLEEIGFQIKEVNEFKKWISIVAQKTKEY